MNLIFTKFTTHSKNALKNAFSFALASGHKTLTPQHILYGLSRQKGSLAAQILTKAKIKDEEIKEATAKSYLVNQTVTQINLAGNTKKLLEKAFLIANLNQHSYIGTEHLLASLLALADPGVQNFFQAKKINLAELQNQVETILNSTAKFPNLADSINYLEDRPDQGSNFENPLAAEQNFYNFAKTSTFAPPAVLNLFATNLTDASIQQKIDPVIGREEEIDRLIQILSRRNKNNPLLLGEAGVGKTAIVEGLAKKIMKGDVPPVLNNALIYTLDLSLIVAGTSFRGEFENRLRQIIEEVKRSPNIILFIDEIHNLIGAGSATGSIDAANILKPALARGEFRCIGATTLQDYKKQIESDPALERRFQPIMIHEASAEKTVAILRGIKSNYEIFHQVRISDEALAAAAQLAERYITDRFLPDKAIDLIDEAAAIIKIKCLNNPVNQELDGFKKQIKEIQQKKKLAVNGEKFDLAWRYRQQEEGALAQLKNLAEQNKNLADKNLAEITAKDIIDVVAKITGVPLAELMLEEKDRLLKLEKTLAEKIIDQPQALASVAEFIRRSRTGIADARRPIGSFMFLGPSGVGKTELAKVLAESVFGSPQSLIKIDMSEFAESFNISKLIGAPAGYVGYKEGARLTDAVKRRPYSVVLFDEIEKAHSQVFNLLLQILEDGGLTDATGKLINFKNTIIIMTSNLGSESFNQQAALGFQGFAENKKEDFKKSWQETEGDVLKKLKEKFPPEFLSRVDKTIVFKPLSSIAVTKIVKLQLAELKKRIAKQGLKIIFEPKVAPLIAELSYSPQTGARAIRKTIQELIESKIANKILANKKNHVKKIIVKARDNKIII